MKRIALIALTLLACSKGEKTNDQPAGSGGTKPSAGNATLNASGSTFQKAFQEEAIAELTTKNPGVKINYGGGGSGKGRQDLSDMVTDFAGSDSPFKDADLAKVKGGEVLYFPVVLGAVTVSYNAGVDKLQLSPDTIAKIFQREVKTWNDPAIAADNPGVTLPATAIVVVHRADGSGTTDIFTKFVEGASTAWKLKSGSTVEWPADTQAGQGNGGVAQLVKSTAGAIGYVDLSDAKASGLKYASIKNSAGKYVEPNAASVSAAAEAVDVKDNLTFSAVNGKGDAAYPIAGQSYIIVYAKQSDAAKANAIKAYLTYLLGDGQKLLEPLDFATLPKALADKALAQLSKIQSPGA
ncbi:MAG TPA: phosphate ABC transporter substrate-binding protein PstS [Kofleriaceae bacterium]|nr:phosphate ABC transporter substrate-binding protein PstS [Kofleriaceae bacterium]